jgi:hypothetical protein
MEKTDKETMTIEVGADVYKCCGIKFVISSYLHPQETLMRIDRDSKALKGVTCCPRCGLKIPGYEARAQ